MVYSLKAYDTPINIVKETSNFSKSCIFGEYFD